MTNSQINAKLIALAERITKRASDEVEDARFFHAGLQDELRSVGQIKDDDLSETIFDLLAQKTLETKKVVKRIAKEIHTRGEPTAAKRILETFEVNVLEELGM